MIKDYSGSMLLVNCRNKIKPAKRKKTAASNELFSATKLLWQAVGAMLLITLVIGISSTIWYGLQVRDALDQIGENKKIYSALHDENKLLLAQRELMLTPNQMEAAGQKLGLRSPAKSQLRYP